MKFYKTLATGLAVAFIMAGLSGCQFWRSSASETSTTGSGENTATNTASVSGTNAQASTTVEYDSEDTNADWSSGEVSNITLNGDSIAFDGKGATVSGSTITITSGGTYCISGTLKDGQIIVNSTEKKKVQLVLNGATITCSNSAPVYIIAADKTIITLADGTQNAVTDGSSYVYADTAAEEPNATIFSKDDLVINGGGSLTVDANFNNAITGKDNVKIISGTITVDSVANGIIGKNYLAVKDGTIVIKAEGEGLKSTNEEDAEKGNVYIDGGTITITAGQDAIEAVTGIVINNGTITLASGGGSANGSSGRGTQGNTWGNWGGGNTTNTTDTSSSAKGIKADQSVSIQGGTITIDSSDDAIHSGNSVTINGGTISIASGDDGIHADTTASINGGRINIAESYEGVESATITIGGGTIYVVSSDDGINVAGGADSSATNGRPGQNIFSSSNNQKLTINGGYLVVDAGGDGLDANGSIYMTGGTAIVNGPTDDGNGPMDYDSVCQVTGGTLIVAGSSGMAQAPDTSSTQYSVLIGFSTQSAGTAIHLETKDGEEILTFVPTKKYASLMVCSPLLEKGSYVVYTGGSSTGTKTDGVYSGGTYSGGTKLTTFTISSIVTTAGNVGTSGGGGFNRR